MKLLHAWAAGAFLALTLSPHSAQAQDEVLIKGEALLTKNCARCHALGATGDSAHAQAPPFRQVVTRYPLDDLAEALAEGLSTGHPDMPEFVFQPSEIDAILAFLGELKEKTANGTANPDAMR